MLNYSVHRLADILARVARFWEPLGGGLGQRSGWPSSQDHRGWAHGILPAVTTAMVIQPNICRILAGVAVGLPGGHASLLLPDACTAAMLPIIC
jgi:hypothetical protein